MQDFSSSKFEFYSKVARMSQKYISAFNEPIDSITFKEIMAYQITANQLRPLEEKKNRMAGISNRKDYLGMSLFAISYYKNKIIHKSKKSIFEQVEKIKTNHHHLYLLTGIRGDNLEICMAMIKKNGGYALCSDPLTAIALRKNNIPHTDLFMPVFQLAKYYDHSKISERLEKYNLPPLDSLSLKVMLRYMALVNLVRIIVKNNNITKTVSYADSMIQKVAVNLDVKTIQIESLILDENRISSLFYNSDKILIYGLQGKRQLIEHGVDESKIILTGNPVLDIFAKENRKTREKPLVLYAPSRLHTEDDIFVQRLADFCQSKNYELAVKLHPKYLNSKIKMVGKIKQIKNISFYQNIQVQKLILECSCLVTDYSSTGIHSQMLGIPTYFCNFTGDDMAFKPPYIQQKMYSDYDDLFDNLVVESGTANDPVFANDFNWKNDGHALDRMVEAVNEV